MTVIEDSFLIPPNKYRNKQNILIACLDWASGKGNPPILAFEETRGSLFSSLIKHHFDLLFAVICLFLKLLFQALQPFAFF